MTVEDEKPPPAGGSAGLGVIERPGNHPETELLLFLNLFRQFKASSWDGWRKVLARITPFVREIYAVAGRGSGKSMMAAFMAVFMATRKYLRGAGEYIYIGIFAPDRKQSSVTFRYVVGLLKSVPALAALIVAETKTSIELSNGVIIEVLTAGKAEPRGRSYALAVIEEGAFLPTDNSANPDVELLRAVRPGLARVPGSLLMVVSSPYARRGVIWNAWQKYHDQPDGDVVFVQAPTLELNPTFDQRAIERALEEDPASAGSEYFALFRVDVSSLLTPDVLDACVVPGRSSLPPDDAIQYEAFADPSGGSGKDSFTLAIAHQTEAGIGVLDLVIEQRPPFSPESTVGDFAAILAEYRIDTVVGDAYAGEWPREAFRKRGVLYQASAKPKSDIYREALPALNSRRFELLDHPRLLNQLAGLERRVGRGGRDSIDHGPASHDDVANAALGVLVGLSGFAELASIKFGTTTSASSWDRFDHNDRFGIYY